MPTDTYVKRFVIVFQVSRLVLQRDEIIRRRKAAAMADVEMMIDAEVLGSDWQIRYGPWVRYDPREDPECRGTIDEFAPIEYRRYLYLHRL